jgi:hypothetical protein
MTNWMISISPSSTSLIYVAISHLHLHMVFISQSLIGMQELVRHTINLFFYSKQSTDKQIDVYSFYNFHLSALWLPVFV